MTRDISRRKLVTGAAWATPAVLSTSLVPAHASSLDVAPCTDFDIPDDNSPYGLENYMTPVAGGTCREARTMGYEEVIVPEEAQFIKFYLRGGAGGSVDAGDYAGGYPGGGAKVVGYLPVTPGQKLKFYVGASGIGYYHAPATGGKGYSDGGDSGEFPDIIEAADIELFGGRDHDAFTYYSASGGGSSALVAVSPHDPSHETLIAVAGGGGGSGARAITGTKTPKENGAKLALWKEPDEGTPRWVWSRSGHPPVPSDGGAGGEGRLAKEGVNGRETYAEYSGSAITVPTGTQGSWGSGGEGGMEPYYDHPWRMTFESTDESTIRTSAVPGANGGDDFRGKGANGVAAYGYVANNRNSDFPQGAPSYEYNLFGRIVSGGGGGGYGGGGSGAALAAGVQTIDQLDSSPSFYAVSLGVVSGGGGGGGSYVSDDVLNPTVMGTGINGHMRGEVEDGFAMYSFCPSRTNKLDHDGSPYAWECVEEGVTNPDGAKQRTKKKP